MSNKLAATYHPHPSFTAMQAAWDPERRAMYPGTLASLTPPDHPDDAWAKANTYPIGNLAAQKRK